MSEETSSAEPPPLQLLALVAVTLFVALVAAAAAVFILDAITPEIDRRSPVAAASLPAAIAAPVRPKWLVRLDIARERNAARRIGKHRRRAR